MMGARIAHVSGASKAVAAVMAMIIVLATVMFSTARPASAIVDFRLRNLQNGMCVAPDAFSNFLVFDSCVAARDDMSWELQPISGGGGAYMLFNPTLFQCAQAIYGMKVTVLNRCDTSNPDMHWFPTFNGNQSTLQTVGGIFLAAPAPNTDTVVRAFKQSDLQNQRQIFFPLPQ